MPSEPSSDRPVQGHIEALPGGQHRWVQGSDPQIATQSSGETLSYATPPTQSRRKLFGGILGVVIGFIVGAPCGYTAGGICVDLMWKDRQWQSDPCPFVAVALFSAIAGALCVALKRAFIAGLLLGVACGLTALALMMVLMAGMHHA